MRSRIWKLLTDNGGKVASAIASVLIAFLTAQISVPSSQYVASLQPTQLTGTPEDLKPPGANSLSIALKCNADPSKTCLTVDRLSFPAVAQPHVRPAEILGTTKSDQKDAKGRQIYEYQVTRCLNGGETLRIDVFTSGMVDLKDLSLKNLEGRELLGSIFECATSESFGNLMHSCEEKVPLKHRLLAVLRVFGGI